MIHFEPVEEPPDFKSQVEKPGLKWLADHAPPSRPPDLWRSFKGFLADGFRNLCAYSAMYEPVGTIDQFVGLEEDRTKAYQWSNYRFAAAWINSSKQDLKSHDILDPFEVGRLTGCRWEMGPDGTVISVAEQGTVGRRGCGLSPHLPVGH